MAIRVRALVDADRPWAGALIEREWGVPVVTPAGAYDAPESLDGVVAEIDGERAGVVTYVRRGGDWEVVTALATVEGAGAGRAMLERVRHLAESSGAARVWLITTDDTGAAAFFERLGMIRRRTHERFVDVVRALKPSSGGYCDADEYEWRLRPDEAQ